MRRIRNPATVDKGRGRIHAALAEEAVWMNDFAPLILSVLMLAMLLMGTGGIFLIVKKRDVRRGVLMLIAALVMLANVLIWAWPVRAAAPLPIDVQRFVAQRESCDHWRGEEPYDVARGTEIERAVRKDCTGTDRRLARLKARHFGDATVMAALAGFETRIE
jgi:hypothetical protein